MSSTSNSLVATTTATILLGGTTTVAVLGYAQVKWVKRHGGELLRRESNRMVLATVFLAGLLAIPAMYLLLPGPQQGVPVLVALLWPLLLTATDLHQCLRTMPSWEAMQKRADDTRAAGGLLVGAVFAAGVLLSVLNRTSRGHSPTTARIMLLSVLGVIAALLPVPTSGKNDDLAWFVFAGQRVVLHATIGLFILATLTAATVPTNGAG